MNEIAGLYNHIFRNGYYAPISGGVSMMFNQRKCLRAIIFTTGSAVVNNIFRYV